MVQPSTGRFVPRCGGCFFFRGDWDWDDGGKDAKEGHQPEFADIYILHGLYYAYVMKIFLEMQATHNHMP